MITKREQDKLLYGHWCRFCGYEIRYDNDIKYRSSITSGRRPLNLDGSFHNCVSFEAVKNYYSQYGIDRENK
jgi:hypothetical protein